VEQHGLGATKLFVGSDSRSVRGIEALTALEHVDVPTGVRLHPIARLPHLRVLHVRGPLSPWALRSPLRDRTTRLGPLAAASALEELHLHDARVLELGALAASTSLRVVELSFLRSPNLAPLARLPLRRLVLDAVEGVRLNQVRGLGVEQLDVWGCTHDGLEALATMPNLREVWVFGAGYRNHLTAGALDHLTHLQAGARIVLDGRFDPDQHRAALALLEARGVVVWAGHDPHENGVHPSWWTYTSKLEAADADPPRYVSQGWSNAPVPAGPRQSTEENAEDTEIGRLGGLSQALAPPQPP
jgi:hypothetical protein